MPTPNHDTTSLDGETWRPVPGFESWYEVSSLGRVKSLGTSRSHRPRILRQNLKHNGYLSVCLYRGDCRQRRRMVHRLVLTTFVGECPDEHQACHRDGNGSNNHLLNLYWGTRSQNQLDTVTHGTHKNSRKTHCPQGHPYDEANTRLYRNKWRYCRACKAATDSRRRK